MKFNPLVLIVLVFALLSACQKNGQSTSSNPGTPSPEGRTGGSTPIDGKSGPSDGGGGDTCNNKMIESYRTDITSLPEFREYIFPILEKTSAKKDESGNNPGSPFLLSPHLKNWYLIDCKLQDIPKEKKGLYLETYQTAIHTQREVFIDSISYNKMEKPEKAKLLLHEMVMSYYMLKYLSFEDMCKMMNNCSGDYKLSSHWKMFRPEPYRPLNEEDHQKIRTVTAWLWNNKESATSEEFSSIAKNNDFDKRFSNTDMFKSEINKEINVSIEALARAFKKAEYTTSLPKFCAFDGPNSTSTSKCTTEIKSEIQEGQKYSNVQMFNLVVKIKITRDKDKKVFEQEFYYPYSSDQKSIRVYLSSMGAGIIGAPLSMLANWPGFIGQPIKEGIKSQMLYFILDLKEVEQPEIFQIVYQSYVWYSFEEKTVLENGQNMKQVIGYPGFLPDESESLYFEKELPFQFKAILDQKMVLQSVSIPNPK